jgi:GLPGLI family protein
MSKIIISVVFLVISFLGLQAQEFQGMAVYQSKTSTEDMKMRLSGNKNLTPEMQKSIEERMKKMFEKTFILNFNKTASIYKEEEKLDAPSQGGSGGGMRMWSSISGSGGTYYKNVKEKSYTVDKEFMGKEFLIKDSLPNLKWKMESETRLIGGYNCFKATAIRPISKTDFRNFRPKPDDKNSNTNKDNGVNPSDSNKKTNFMDEMNIPKEVVVTAWYTPEVPVNQGPENYWGLPGLILEINDGKTVILCSKIILNAKEKADIKASTKGKIVSQAEYDAIMIKKMDEFREMNRARGGSSGMQIRMGGQN